MDEADKKTTVSTLDEIKAQAAPQVIEIPGFRQGTTLRLALRPLDLTPHLLAAGIGNPLLEAAQAAAAGKGAKGAIPADLNLEKLLPILDAVAREALVEPPYADITAIAPLTLQQKMAIFNHVVGDTQGLATFRRK